MQNNYVNSSRLCDGCMRRETGSLLVEVMDCPNQCWLIVFTLLYYLLLMRSLTHPPRTKWPPFRRRYFQIFFNGNVWISIKISLKFVPNGPINNIEALVQIMAWRLPGDKSLPEPMRVGLLTHTYVTRQQWIKDRRQWMSINNSSSWNIYWGRNKLAALFQAIFSNAFSWTKTYDIRLSFH